jgi:hypothetical protein
MWETKDQPEAINNFLERTENEAGFELGIVGILRNVKGVWKFELEFEVKYLLEFEQGRSENGLALVNSSK